MGYVKFPPKAITTWFGEDERFEWQKNYNHSKSANF